MFDPIDNSHRIRRRTRGGRLVVSILLTGAMSVACEDGVGPGAAPLQIQPGSATLALGDTLRLSARWGDEPAGTGVTWRSLDEATVTVDSTGLATAVGPGDALVVAGFGDSTASAALRVSVPFVSLFVGPDFSCGRARGGETFCWGSNEWGQGGDGTSDGLLHPRPRRMPGLEAFESLTAGRVHVCARLPAGEAWCWGRNFFGQLGNGTDTSSIPPGLVAGGYRFQSLNAGTDHTCGITMDGRAFCWGSNRLGALGVDSAAICGGATPCSPVPVAVQGGRVFTSLSAGAEHTCGVTEGGELYCWGSNREGQLSQPDSLDRTAVPALVPLLSVASVAAGPFHTCARQTDGRTFCWGSNYGAALGIGDTLFFYRFTPVEVAGNLRFAELATGRGMAQGSVSRTVTCGVTNEAVAYCWGTGEDGQTGTGGTGPVGAPTPVAGEHRFTTVGAGLGFACGLTQEGAAQCWGSNLGARLGRDDLTRSLVPVPVLAAEGR